ncbi:Cir_N domain-containing protein [Cephalotus follicularis]|uniref:Cir_N domain-containing protein n=1 Tax=Cephalotus follicularis TaxID=3775 RepID=A0A1Q3D6S6_CEPFO|nr:Cir_N domain-containing protein [Cephalotus follicularis]
MEGEEGGGMRLSKRINNGEVDYKNKSGTAWSHSYLNQKPWHPLSYPNQRRKWIAEQTHANRQRRSEQVSREYAQEQEFFRQTALISKKEKEKIEMMKAVSFMYVRPPGYNAESAKAAEIADERQKEEQNDTLQDPPTDGASAAMPLDGLPGRGHSGIEKKKPRPKDVFGRCLPTEEEFEVLKNAPRLETGVPARSKPFAIEVRNVKCVRCGNFGHQSGDRECLLKDAIMPNEESRLKRDDPLTSILACTDPSEPLKWELKQKPGISPPRGGFKADDPNQQIIAEEIFDEYGGFLSGDNIPELLANFSSRKPGNKKSKKKSKHKRRSSSSIREPRAPGEDGLSLPYDNVVDRRSKKKEKKLKKNKRNYSESSSSENLELERRHRKSRHKRYSSEDSEFDSHYKSNISRQKHSYFSSSEDDTFKRYRGEKSRHRHTYVSLSEDDSRKQHKGDKSGQDSYSAKHHKSERSQQKHSYPSFFKDDSYKNCRSEYNEQKTDLGSSEEDYRKHHRSEKSRQKYSYSQDSDFDGHQKSDRHQHYGNCQPGSGSISD